MVIMFPTMAAIKRAPADKHISLISTVCPLVAPAVLELAEHRLLFGLRPTGGHWLGYLVAGPGDSLEPGKRWYNWGWYRAGDEAVLRDHLTDAQGKYYEHGSERLVFERCVLIGDAAFIARPHLDRVSSISRVTEDRIVHPMMKPHRPNAQ